MIRHLATSADGDLFATGEFEHSVTVWSLTARAQVAAFETVLDFGGTRLGLAGGEDPLVLTGAYFSHGLVAYDARTGEFRWQRKDLKGVQRVSVSEGVGRATVGLEKGGVHVLDLESGATEFVIRGGQYGTIDADGAFVTGRGWVAMVNRDGSPRWRKKVDSWGNLGLALGPCGAVVGLLGRGETACYDRTTGSETWTYRKSGWAMDGAAWCARDERWRLAMRKLGGGIPRWQILEFDAMGDRMAVNGFLEGFEVELFRDGTRMTTSKGAVIDLPSMTAAWEFLAE